MTQSQQDPSPRKVLIGGKWVESLASRFGPVTDPTSNTVIARVPMCGASDVAAAVEAAAKAFATWSDVPPPKRAAVMFKFQNLLLAEQDNLARLVSQEHGKVLSDAAGSVRRGIDMVEFACSIPSLSNCLLMGPSLPGWSRRGRPARRNTWTQPTRRRFPHPLPPPAGREGACPYQRSSADSG